MTGNKTDNKKGPLKRGLFEVRDADLKTLQDFISKTSGIVKISVPMNVEGSRAILTIALKAIAPSFDAGKDFFDNLVKTQVERKKKEGLPHILIQDLVANAHRVLLENFNKEMVGLVGEVGEDKKKILLLFIPGKFYAYSME